MRVFGSYLSCFRKKASEPGRKERKKVFWSRGNGVKEKREGGVGKEGEKLSSYPPPLSLGVRPVVFNS